MTPYSLQAANDKGTRTINYLSYKIIVRKIAEDFPFADAKGHADAGLENLSNNNFKYERINSSYGFLKMKFLRIYLARLKVRFSQHSEKANSEQLFPMVF